MMQFVIKSKDFGAVSNFPIFYFSYFSIHI